MQLKGFFVHKHKNNVFKDHFLGHNILFAVYVLVGPARG